MAHVTEQRFRAMGSDVHVIVVGGPAGLAEHARDRLRDLEGRWSRFIPASEVSVLNHRAGLWTEVSPETVALVERALVARERTDGLFDPTRLADVVRAGYASSFGEPGFGNPPSDAEAEAVRGAGEVEVDRIGGRVRVAEGAGFDPGGIGKGFAADLVAAEVMDEGAGGVCVNVGGDLRVRGRGPDGGDWAVGIDDPRDDDRSAADGAPLMVLSLADGAVATSSRCRRRWTRPDGSPAHHLIDPRTGDPAETEVLAATVVAADGWQAEALAKTAFLLSRPAFLARLAEAGATGLVVTTDGVTRAPGLGRFVA